MPEPVTKRLGERGKDPTGTIRDCTCSHKVPGLVAYAREQIALKKVQRSLKEDQELQQRERDSVESAHRSPDMSSVTVASAGSFRSAGDSSVSKRPRLDSVAEQLTFTNRWVAKLNRTAANLVIKEATLLVLVQKPAFKELVSAAIEFGHHVGMGVYTNMSKGKLRNIAIPEVIAR